MGGMDIALGGYMPAVPRGRTLYLHTITVTNGEVTVGIDDNREAMEQIIASCHDTELVTSLRRDWPPAVHPTDLAR